MKPIHASSNEHHLAKDLKFDEAVQREVMPHYVNKLAAVLNLDSVGVITVSRRKRRGGKADLYVLDGQHRILALLHHDLGDWPVNCHVYDNLSLAEEAALFRSLNASRKITAFDSFRTGVTAKDSECLAIKGILEARGLTVTRQATDGGIRAVAALQASYRRQGADALADALDIIVDAWGAKSESLDGNIIAGVSQLTGRYNGDLDHAALSRKLAKFPGGPASLIGHAKGLRELRTGISVPRALAEIVHSAYNKGRRRGQLPAL